MRYEQDEERERDPDDFVDECDDFASGRCCWCNRPRVGTIILQGVRHNHCAEHADVDPGLPADATPELWAHYRDECGGLPCCDYCLTLARLEDQLKVPDGEELWPVEMGGES
jgi:hypothetical protein